MASIKINEEASYQRDLFNSLEDSFSLCFSKAYSPEQEELNDNIFLPTSNLTPQSSFYFNPFLTSPSSTLSPKEMENLLNDSLSQEIKRQEQKEIPLSKKFLSKRGRIPHTEKDTETKKNMEENSIEEQINNKSKRQKHTKYDRDNIFGKIQVHYISFLVDYTNYKIKQFLPGRHLKFSDIDYSFKKMISKASVKSLKEKTIGQILQNPPSTKNKPYIKDLGNLNKNIFDIVYNECPKIKEILDKNYLDLFHGVYYKKYNGDSYEDEIERKNGIVKFNDLLKKIKQKNNGDDFYIEKMIKMADTEFIKPGTPIFKTFLQEE